MEIETRKWFKRRPRLGTRVVTVSGQHGTIDSYPLDKERVIVMRDKYSSDPLLLVKFNCLSPEEDIIGQKVTVTFDLNNCFTPTEAIRAVREFIPREVRIVVLSTRCIYKEDE